MERTNLAKELGEGKSHKAAVVATARKLLGRRENEVRQERVAAPACRTPTPSDSESPLAVPHPGQRQ